MSLARRATLVACVVAASLTWKATASAFGGVYFTEDDRSVRVTSHRLAVALGRGQTVEEIPDTQSAEFHHSVLTCP